MINGNRKIAPVFETIYMDAMRRALNYASWLGRKIFALSCGILIGAILATSIVSKSPMAAVVLVKTLDPISGNPGEIDRNWIIWVEWKVALIYASLVAIAATPIWSILVWKRNASYIAATVLGFLMAFGAACLAFVHDDMTDLEDAVGRNILIGCAGAFTGFVVFMIDRLLKRASV